MAFSRSVLLGALLAMGQISEAKELINNVYYCNEVDKIQYTNVGCSGTFKTPSFMEDNGGACNVGHAERSYGGPLAPLNEQITIHMRGPLQLFQFAVYNIDNTPDDDYYVKREEHAINRRQHHHHEKRKVKTEVVEEVITITKYVDDPTSTTSALYDAPSAVVANAVNSNKNKKNKKKKKKSEWKRTGYYNAAKQIRDGLVFLNNKGGQDSGKWTSCFGNSLAYMSADGKAGSATPQTLADGAVFGVNEEFSIWTNQTCDGSCGFAYASEPCYRGFDGDNKVFAFEFQMPTDTKNAGNIYGNSNMPAIWSLNSLIARTQQYPADKTWSCWDYGCGEFDIWEVLHWDYPASQYMTSTLHSAQGSPGTGKGGGGTCDYFKRPTDTKFKGMVSFLSDGTITIQKLDDDFNFPEYLTTKDIKKNFSDGMPRFNIPS